MARLLVAVALLPALALTVAACGSKDKAGPNPAELVPSDAVAYVDAVLRPSGELRDNFDSVSEKLTNGMDVGAKLKRLLTKEAQKEGFSYSEDVESWLGERAGGFISKVDQPFENSDGGVIVASKDNGKARAAIDKFVKLADEDDDEPTESRQYGGIQYKVSDRAALGIVGDFVVLATEPAFKQAVDLHNNGQESLSQNDDYKQTIDELPDNQLVTFYGSFADVVEPLRDLITAAIEESAPDPEIGRQLRRQFDPDRIEEALKLARDVRMAFGLDVQSDLAGFELVSRMTGDKPLPEQIQQLLNVQGDTAGLLDDLPGDAWLALGLPNLGASYKAQLDFLPGSVNERQLRQLKRMTGLDLETDLFNWMGNVTAFVRGTDQPSLGGGVEIETTDKAAAERALDRLTNLAVEQSKGTVSRSTSTVEGATGYRLQFGPGLGVDAVMAGSDLLVGYGAKSVADMLNPSSKLADSDTFKNASESLHGTDPLFFVDMGPVVQLAQSFAGNDPDFQQAKPYLEAVAYLIAGSSQDKEQRSSKSRLAVGVK